MPDKQPPAPTETWQRWLQRVFPNLTEQQCAGFGKQNSVEQLEHFEVWINTPWAPPASATDAKGAP